MEAYFKVRDGVELLYTKDIAKNPKGAILINHGFAEHMLRYDNAAKTFMEAGYTVYRYDLRGHGRSKSQLGYVDTFDDFILDADEMVDLIIRENKDCPIFMLGHSMGGLISALYGIRYKNKLKGQIFSGAALGTLPSAAGIRKTIYSFAKIFFGKLKIKNPVDYYVCTVKEVVDAYLADPLVLKKAYLHFYVEFLVSSVRTLNNGINSYNYPCLITHGGND